ncbi:TetR/AcrR family transcriptional regulator [Sciscionella sediminilitoris]|uniref:TetR/AcrR family transcriptional regulator n=1 Tax=Sciscionella sediminilitoris TaxID=1445613 RepID=UPI0004DF7024|nr:TetR/AcrR family transcriptional regulator [Sciscionella sp. SE31]
MGTEEATALLWEGLAAPKRGPRPTLRLDAIAGEGIALADAEGIDSVTMQRVAAALGVTKMALYRYVPGKNELVALMTDIAIGEPPRLAEVEGGWRPRLYAWALRMSERFWRHPWTLRTTVGRRPFGPNELGWLEESVAALDGTGLEGGEKLDVAATLSGHVRSLVQQGVARVSEDGIEGRFTALVRGREERFPALLAAMKSAETHDSQNKAFEFGLERILDGVGSLLEQRA